ncbi:hypothetical protein MNBD_GAMMA07-2544 [hydrothermal vent metagenome]|uniref:Uncharacterized protein n=1 Tax=hydrothermal vent metagenome TaxID=652676 RepID=A0A3B0WXB2_9ZZZZ
MFISGKRIVTLLVIGMICMNHSDIASAKDKYENFSWTSPNQWEGALFDVPTWFAKDMLYTGKEVIRFHDGFYDKKSVGFWTYAFVLLIDQIKTPKTEELIDETHRYFLGLVRTLGDNSKPNYPKEKIIVKKNSEWITDNSGKQRSQNYTLFIFDSFSTGKSLMLNAKITTWLCSNQKRAIHYAVSPHPMTHAIWKKLNKEISALKCW